jgi:hypothetical protein
MRPQITSVGGKICRGGQFLPVMFLYWPTGRDAGNPGFIGLLARHFLGMAFAEVQA